MSLLSNLTSDGRIEIECDSSYNNNIEITKYVVQMVYLVPGLMVHIAILRTILWKYRKFYRSNSFFMIYTMDSIASLTLLTIDVLYGRMMIYVPPLCPILTPLFFDPSIILKILYILPNYARGAKSVTQIMMSLNRMSCVISPLSYVSRWRFYIKIAIFIISTSPLLVTWNLFLSRMYVSPTFGGFSYNYIKYVKWASLSLFQFTFLSLAIIFTVICTAVTLGYLLMLPNRVKTAERTLCIANVTISGAFMIVAFFQSIFAFCSSCNSDTLFSIQFLSYDFLNISSPIVIIMMNPQLREHMFHKNQENSNAFFKVSVVTQSNGRSSNIVSTNR